ncbi:MAG TPA: ABC transporter ATP-binding protein [Acidobacteriota bacterium]|nr:ABC transporter ATP-binding protein [Acidobacteriota bacterium]
MSETILKVENVVKVFGKTQILKGINLEIKAGEIFGIIGSSGAGKSTLLNTIIGFLPPTSGAILFQNPHLLTYEGAEKDTIYRNVLEYPKEVKKLFGFAAQRPSVYGKLTLNENLDLFGSLYDLSYDARSTNTKILLKLMGLYDSKSNLAEKLSGGMMKRLDIACSLIHDPKILILDEPTADLDPYLRKQMWYLIRKINSKGTTIVLSSHFLDELEELCDRIGIIHDGKMENYGTPNELKKLFKGGEEVHVSTIHGRYAELEERLSKQKIRLKISDMNNLGHELVIRTTKPIEVVRDLMSATRHVHDEILDLRINRPSLNEVFENIIQHSNDESIEKQYDDAEKQKEQAGKKKSFWQKLFGKKEKAKPAASHDDGKDTKDNKDNKDTKDNKDGKDKSSASEKKESK